MFAPWPNPSLPLALNAHSPGGLQTWLPMLAAMSVIIGPLMGWLIGHERRISRTEQALLEGVRRMDAADRDAAAWRQRLEIKQDEQSAKLDQVLGALREMAHAGQGGTAIH
ncbi:MAG: hypothetical protein M1472_04160 [Planctomycetes bacterium]|jgi:hypothetical protein|nr:hypothetical protein [Planctomycetota bacterium]MDA8375957.1 hypothetical protein [Planctomycetia bacterium]